MKVKFLPPKEIEAATLALLAKYGSKFGSVKAPPIPVEEILECLLELRLDFDDLSQRLGMPDVLGATWVQEKQVLIDSSLDPTIDTSKEGRYRFTVSHELGHWELHRHLYRQGLSQPLLFNAQKKPSIICRGRSKKEPIEWQADTFAGYLLMPREMVYKVWKDCYGSLTPYKAAEEIAHLTALWELEENDWPTVEISKKLAPEFKVSGQAMQVRLVNLGLIETKESGPDLLTYGKSLFN